MSAPAPVARQTPKSLLAAATALRKKGGNPVIAAQLDAVAAQLSDLSIAAGEALALMLVLEEQIAVRLPFPRWDSTKAMLMAAAGLGTPTNRR